MPHTEVIHHELSFAHKMSLQTLLDLTPGSYQNIMPLNDNTELRTWWLDAVNFQKKTPNSVDYFKWA